MKRLWLVAIVALLSLSAAAQIRGIPASVTSITPTRSVSGVPASVTSLGPNGYGGHHRGGFSNFNSVCSSSGPLIPSAMGCTNPYFTRPYYHLPLNEKPMNLHPGEGFRGGYYPVYVPYTVPIPVVVEPVPVEAVPEEGTVPASLASEEEVQPPAMTVYEHRPTTTVKPTTPPIDESRVYHPGSQQAAAEQEAEPPAPPIVLIYKDGHQGEVQNYAIVGDYLYEVSGYSTHKIPLAELNIPATIKANDDRGIEFSIPAGAIP